MQIPGKKIFEGEKFLTDWMTRGGDGFILRGEMIDATPSTTLKVKVEVYTKNSEVAGEGDALEETGSANAVNIELAADGTSIVEVIVEPSGTANKGVEEMIRLRVTTSGGSSGDWLLCRTFPIIWFDGAR
jgi:hypothetical protein